MLSFYSIVTDKLRFYGTTINNPMYFRSREVFSFSVPDLYSHRDDLSEEMYIKHNRRFDEKIKIALEMTIRRVINSCGNSSKMIVRQMSIQRYIMREYYVLSKHREEKYG